MATARRRRGLILMAAGAGGLAAGLGLGTWAGGAAMFAVGYGLHCLLVGGMAWIATLVWPAWASRDPDEGNWLAALTFGGAVGVGLLYMVTTLGMSLGFGFWGQGPAFLFGLPLGSFFGLAAVRYVRRRLWLRPE